VTVFGSIAWRAESVIVDDLPESVRESLLSGYRNGRQGNAAAASSSAAYEDGARLRHAIDGTFWADTQSEVRGAVERYDALAAEQNGKYGVIVVLSTESSDLGLRGYRQPAYGTVTDTTYDADGNAVVTGTDHAAQVRADDTAVRRGEPR
jgi:hypothetical protein